MIYAELMQSIIDIAFMNAESVMVAFAVMLCAVVVFFKD